MERWSTADPTARWAASARTARAQRRPAMPGRPPSTKRTSRPLDVRAQSSWAPTGEVSILDLPPSRAGVFRLCPDPYPEYSRESVLLAVLFRGICVWELCCML